MQLECMFTITSLLLIHVQLVTDRNYKNAYDMTDFNYLNQSSLNYLKHVLLTILFPSNGYQTKPLVWVTRQAVCVAAGRGGVQVFGRHLQQPHAGQAGVQPTQARRPDCAAAS